MPFPNKECIIAIDDNADMRVSLPWSDKEHERLAEVGRCYLERWINQCWIENDADGFTGYRWEKYNRALRIVAAANRYKDIVVIGPRHYSNGMQTAIDALGGTTNLHKYAGEDYDQGFVDQFGTYHDRKEAWIIAEAQGQILYPDIGPSGTLYSEHLY